jgi:hypothetical protein
MANDQLICEDATTTLPSGVTRTATMTVPDARGKTYKFEVDAEGGVTIRPPGTLKVTPVRVEDLRAVVDTFAPLSMGDLVERLAAALMEAGDSLTLTKTTGSY